MVNYRTFIAPSTLLSAKHCKSAPPALVPGGFVRGDDSVTGLILARLALRVIIVISYKVEFFMKYTWFGATFAA